MVLCVQDSGTGAAAVTKTILKRKMNVIKNVQDMSVKVRFPLICVTIITITCLYMSLVVRKPAFCICENKDADQLRGNHEADQRLCFRCTDSTIPVLPKSEISSL